MPRYAVTWTAPRSAIPDWFAFAPVSTIVARADERLASLDRAGRVRLEGRARVLVRGDDTIIPNVQGALGNLDAIEIAFVVQSDLTARSVADNVGLVLEAVGNGRTTVVPYVPATHGTLASWRSGEAAVAGTDARARASGEKVDRRIPLFPVRVPDISVAHQTAELIGDITAWTGRAAGGVGTAAVNALTETLEAAGRGVGEAVGGTIREATSQGPGTVLVLAVLAYLWWESNR